MLKRTRIVATIGPACATIQTLTAFVRAGMQVARLNFSHGTYPEHAHYITMLRAVARREHRTITLLQDLSGPKVRVGIVPDAGVRLHEGKTILLSNNTRRVGAIPFQYIGLPGDVKQGDTILFDDGLLEVVVMETTAHEITARVVVGGLLTSHKGINVPGASLRIPAITPKDKKDLAFGLAHGVDWVALSFVRSARDVVHLRDLIAAAHPKNTPLIIAKIEKHEAVEHVEEIIRAADGIMVARGDLGIEIMPEQVPLVQKRIIRLCNEAEKPTIVATQMLDSMIRNPRPTRAEVSDVANAVIDQTEAVMLSGESASGKYPRAAVEMMRRIITTVEQSGTEHNALVCHMSGVGYEDQLLGEIALAATELHRAAAVIIPYASRHILPTLVRFRPGTIILVQVKTEAEAGQINLRYGVYPIIIRTVTARGAVAGLVRMAKKEKLLTRGDAVIVMSEQAKHARLLSLEEITVA